MSIENQELQELFRLADEIGIKRYHRLTHQDFEDYRQYDFWRYINGDGECGTTSESQDWVRSHSSPYCPICGDRYSRDNGRTIDHKLPRSQYPWLSMEFKNLWVICRSCNKEKGEMHWYEYERYIFIHSPELYLAIKAVRPKQLLQALKD